MSCDRFWETEEAGRPVSKFREKKRIRPKVQGGKKDFFLPSSIKTGDLHVTKRDAALVVQAEALACRFFGK